MRRLNAAHLFSIFTGFVGSTALGIGAIAVGWLPPLFDTSTHPVLNYLRNSDQGQLVGHVAVVVGGGLLLQAWLLLGMHTLAGERISFELSFVAWTAPLWFVPPTFSRDVFSYIAQARLLQHGIDPYVEGVSALPGWFALGVDPAWAETPTPYGPLSLLTQLAVVSATANAPWWSQILFRALNLLSIWAIYHAVKRLSAIHGIDSQNAIWLAVLNPLVALHLVLGVHNDAWMIALMLWAFVFALNRQAVAALLLITCSIAVKPIAFVALPFVIQAYCGRGISNRRRILEYILGGGQVAILLFIIGKASGLGFGWINALTTPGSVRTLLSPSTAIGESIGAVVENFSSFAREDVTTTVHWIAIGIAALLLTRLALRPSGKAPLRSCAIAFSILIAFSPVLQPWYLLWALPLAAAVGISKPWHLRTMVIGSAFFVLYALTEANVVTDSQIGWTDFASTAAAALVVAGVLLISPGERQLALGNQFAHGLTPRTESDASKALSQIVR